MGGRTDEKILSDVWKSTDGTLWTLVTDHADFGHRFDHTSLVFDNKLWVIAGESYTNTLKDVWYSTDGLVWLPSTHDAAFGRRRSHASVVYNSLLYVIGGINWGNSTEMDDVWTSPDGVTWTEVTGDVGFMNRQGHRAEVFMNWIVVIAGFRHQLRNDMWVSADGGANWIRVTGNATFPGRYKFSTVVQENQIIVIGGFGLLEGNNSVLNDVWKTVDGVRLQQVQGYGSFASRFGHTSVVFKEQIQIIGGRNNNGYTNEVYNMTYEGNKLNDDQNQTQNPMKISINNQTMPIYKTLHLAVSSSNQDNDTQTYTAPTNIARQEFFNNFSQQKIQEIKYTFSKNQTINDTYYEQAVQFAIASQPTTAGYHEFFDFSQSGTSQLLIDLVNKRQYHDSSIPSNPQYLDMNSTISDTTTNGPIQLLCVTGVSNQGGTIVFDQIKEFDNQQN